MSIPKHFICIPFQFNLRLLRHTDTTTWAPPITASNSTMLCLFSTPPSAMFTLWTAWLSVFTSWVRQMSHNRGTVCRQSLSRFRPAVHAARCARRVQGRAHRQLRLHPSIRRSCSCFRPCRHDSVRQGVHCQPGFSREICARMACCTCTRHERVVLWRGVGVL